MAAMQVNSGQGIVCAAPTGGSAGVLPGVVVTMLDDLKIPRADVVRAAGLNETYGYQLFTGQRTNPSRNKVLQIAFAMSLSLKEASRLLQAAGANDLYCKRRRDAIIAFCLSKGCSLYQTNEELYRLGEDTIC